MYRHKGFAPIAALIVLIVLAVLIAQCDVRYAAGPPAGAPFALGGTP